MWVCVDMTWLLRVDMAGVCVDMAGVGVDMSWLVCVDVAGV